MSDYELASLFFTIMEAAQATFANFLAIISGMIAVSYFFAHKLDRTLSALLLVIFSLFSLGFINEIFAAYSDLPDWALRSAHRASCPRPVWAGWARSLAALAVWHLCHGSFSQ